MTRFARAKTKLQRVTGYISLGTFLLVMYQFANALYPNSPWVLAAMFGAGLLIIICIAELDWHYVFEAEQAVTNIKNPLMYPMVLSSAWMLTHASHHPDIETKLRETWRAVGAEDLFDSLLEELSRDRE